jgi:hypothetical protein
VSRCACSTTFLSTRAVRVLVFDFREVFLCLLATVGTEPQGSSRRTCGMGIAGARPRHRAGKAGKVRHTHTRRLGFHFSCLEYNYSSSLCCFVC